MLQQETGHQEKIEQDKLKEDILSKKLSLEEILSKKEEEYNVLWDKYLRLCADFDNARKRWEREKEDTIKFANFILLKDITVVLDEMEQALKIIKEHSDITEIVKGLQMCYDNFIGVLKKRGLISIDAKGRKFDPHFHEIVGSKEVEGDQEHIVLEEVQKGYLFENKLLRTSKVIIGVKKQITEDIQQTEDRKPTKDEGPFGDTQGKLGTKDDK